MTKLRSQSGFTIIELLIATVVFSVVLLLVTQAVIQFSRQYYKGVISSSTQGAARSLIDDISRSIEFNAGGVTPISGGWCIGDTKRYSYKLGQEVTDGSTFGPHQGPHALVSDRYTGCTSGSPALDMTSTAPLSTPDARELLGQHMRLANFQITSSGNLYTITVRVVYGDDDLLCSPSANDCNQTTMSSNAALSNTDLSCKQFAGSQFCAASELKTTVERRLNT